MCGCVSTKRASRNDTHFVPLITRKFLFIPLILKKQLYGILLKDQDFECKWFWRSGVQRSSTIGKSPLWQKWPPLLIGRSLRTIEHCRRKPTPIQVHISSLYLYQFLQEDILNEKQSKITFFLPFIGYFQATIHPTLSWQSFFTKDFYLHYRHLAHYFNTRYRLFKFIVCCKAVEQKFHLSVFNQI